MYYKHVLVVSEKLVESLGWKEGDELSASKKKGKMVVGKG